MFSVSFNTEPVSGNMESQRSNESLFNFRKLESFLLLKEMQIGLFKLQSYYSSKNHSVKYSKSNASSSKHKGVHQLTWLNEISQDNFPDAKKESCRSKMEMLINSRQMSTDSGNLSSGSEGSESSLANSCESKYRGNSRTGKRVLLDAEIDQMSQRLELLEKESKMMKQELFEEVEEREKLMNEIYEQFQLIYSCLQLENPVLGERGSDESLMVNSYE